MPSRKFQRKIEDFHCEICGELVKGDGYTNHCPKCLWSKHVDNNPGDRGNNCRGMMEPIGVFQKNGQWRLDHRCRKCGKTMRVKMGKGDDFNKVINLYSRF